MAISTKQSIFNAALENVSSLNSTVGVIGLGYVGLPLAAAAGDAGFKTIGFDVDSRKLPGLNAGKSYIDAVKSKDLSALVKAGLFRATDDMSELALCDVIIICVPTPLTKQREPDMSYIIQTSEAIAKTLRAGQTIILESTTYPGTTTGLVKPILEAGGLKSGEDFFLGFSPEREDPGNKHFGTTSIPKVAAGDGLEAGKIVQAFYEKAISVVVPVSTPDTAEAVKITENIFRAVNIALVNELKVVYDAMGIDVWEVIDAASTKPFGFMPFYPGPGLGGHCIPIDPFYLTWKAREFEIPTRFIELAGEVNTFMPHYVVRRLGEILDMQAQKSIGQAKILMLGMAYKKNVSDIRESPALKIMELIKSRGGHCDYHDPHVEALPNTRHYPQFSGQKSVALSAQTLKGYDLVLIVTDHDSVDYEDIAKHTALIIDTRNVMARRGIDCKHTFKA